MTVKGKRRRVLQIVAECNADEPSGIEVANILGGIGRSSTYAELAVLQRDGLVSARWDRTGIRPRRRFSLTALGMLELALSHAREAT